MQSVTRPAVLCPGDFHVIATAPAGFVVGLPGADPRHHLRRSEALPSGGPLLTDVGLILATATASAA